jgi:hypothetical protein
VAAALMLAAASPALADDISRDLRDIRHDRADIYRDRVKLREEQAERNYDARREWRAIRHGNYWAAEMWDARRRQEQREINALGRDLHKDRVDLGKDRADLRRDLWRRGY